MRGDFQGRKQCELSRWTRSQPLGLLLLQHLCGCRHIAGATSSASGVITFSSTRGSPKGDSLVLAKEYKVKKKE